MGANHSHVHAKVSRRSSEAWTLREIERLKVDFKKKSTDGKTITKEQFKHTLKNNVQSWSTAAQHLFLERLFDAFDVDNSGNIDFDEFTAGLTVFMNGSPEEKMDLSFRLYDIDKSGSLEPKELIKIMGQMYSAFYNEDKKKEIKAMVHQIFDDLDINGDQSLSISEYRLMALKEPMMIDFLEQFLYIQQPTE